MVNNKKYLWYYSKLFSRFENVMPTKHADIRISVKLIFQKKKETNDIGSLEISVYTSEKRSKIAWI